MTKKLMRYHNGASVNQVDAKFTPTFSILDTALGVNLSQSCSFAAKPNY
jgi:hypothetical protein